jgi:patatin-like phospholipase/acyl hydrolase
MSPTADSPSARFRILCVDGGGIRGLISVRVIAAIEKALAEQVGESVRISDYFHLFSGTSTGGLIALSLTAPSEIDSEELASFYTKDGPKIFDRSLVQEVTNPRGLAGPLYGLAPLRKAVEDRLGTSKLSEATRDLVVTSYDMTKREPFFFKRWKALESEEFDPPIADAALATSAAPTYFPSHGITLPGESDERALVDGGVFAANPVIAAIAEALGRGSDPPAALTLDDLFVVSIGTGRFVTGFSQKQVSGWGALGWVAGGGSEPPVLSAMLGGSSDGADYWAHMLLNHVPGEGPPGSAPIGRGERYFRLQVELKEAIEMDDASETTLTKLLPAEADRLIAERSGEIKKIAQRLATAGKVE